MFGYIVTNLNALDADRQKRFRALYCGLCRTLRKRHGFAGSATLSYDLTFLALLLNALYEPGEEAGAERCPAHPAKRHEYAARNGEYAFIEEHCGPFAKQYEDFCADVLKTIREE